MSDLGELRALVRELIRDVLPDGLPVIETVNLSTDEDMAAFVERLLDLDPEQRGELRSGRKRFRLAAAQVPAAPAAPIAPVPAGPVPRTERAGESSPVRRIERGAVTEAMINQAARQGERLLLGRGAVLTPLARDRARASGVPIEKEG
jgi:hypothetical protein